MRRARLGLVGAMVVATAMLSVFPAIGATQGVTHVTLMNVAYNPAIVTIHVGDTVLWKHMDGSTPHSVTSDPASSERFDSSPSGCQMHPTPSTAGCMKRGQTFSHTFNGFPGTFTYQCRIHGSSMRGTVVVEAAATTTVKPTTTTARATTTSELTTTSTSRPATETLALGPTTTEPTSTTAAALKIHQTKTTNNAAVAALVVGILGVLGAAGYVLYRLLAR